VVFSMAIFKWIHLERWFQLRFLPRARIPRGER
jgi:hypothetical protein